MTPHTAGLTEELLQIRDTTARFMREQVLPAEAQVEHDAFSLPDELLQPLRAQARAMGLWALRAPAEYGGAGLSLMAATVIAEEAAKCRMGAYVPACGAIAGSPPGPIMLGTPEQIERFALPAIRHGDKAYVAISEATGGSDPARAIRTRAVRQGDRYILNGTKMWITGAAQADWGLLFARTGEQGQRSGITCFIIDGRPKGLTLREIPVIRSYSPYELHLDNVEVPVENRLGEEGQGFALCEKWLVEGRVPYAAGTIGIAQEALRIATDWAREREVFRSKLADKQSIQWMLADSEMELRAARLLIHEAAARGDAGLDFKTEASICKVVATETAGRVLDRCIQIMGGMGVAKEMPLERWYREMRIKRIGEGPSEVHRMVLARSMVGGGAGRA